ncbi:hypothetical protein N7532_007560 [Penicillium argentinense]|uniref:Uncharacterized protein n=1 Tax=Penicillium argentinense TaxID=1131581 RepID=A0A9W9F864_9EURO|nr:uncharacterized protein N7532_007560 [Penicillium argentinense]KAJ5095269.1 hypothetical protein N7532_007560 [Penicillium argentinense]
MIKLKRRFRKTEGLSATEKDKQLGLALADEIDKAISRQKQRPRGKHFQIDGKKSPCLIRRVHDVVEERHNHRIVLLETKAYPDPKKPTTTELQVLVRLMLEEMRLEFTMGREVKIFNRAHHMVPVLVVSVYLGGQARVITGNLHANMGSLIQWALPVVRGDTTRTVPMPSIAEEEWEELAGKSLLTPSYPLRRFSSIFNFACSQCLTPALVQNTKKKTEATKSCQSIPIVMVTFFTDFAI